MKLYTEQDRLIQMHPALDIVNDVVYVTVKVRDEKGRTLNAIITSEQEVYDYEEWALEQKKRGLESYTDVNLECSSRWNHKSITTFLDGKLEAPTWKETYEAIYQAYDERLVVSDQRYLVVLTLHAMMTYFHPLFDFLPILHLRGPAESGKSRAGSALAKVAFNGKMDGSATPSTIFRRANEARYTQIIAETDHLAQLSSGDAFARQLQSGCSKAEATVEVSEGRSNKSFTPISYRIFNPRVLLSTKQFKSQPLRSRCIRLDLVKQMGADETKLRRSLEDETVWEPLRDKLYSLLMLRWKEVANTRDYLKREWSGLPGRTFEKWLPLATIAGLVSQEVFNDIHQLAEKSLEEQQEDAENVYDALLFKFAARVVQSGDQFLSRGELYDMFVSPSGTSFGGNDAEERAQWAEDTDAAITTTKLKGWIRSDRMLISELKRLHLIPQNAKHTRSGDRYELNQAEIMRIVGAYIGTNFLK